MQACIVHRCTRPALAGLCAHHGGPAPVVRPMTDRETALADLLDPDAIARDVADHNARVATNVMLDALR